MKVFNNGDILIKVLIIYNSITFISIRYKYSIYKRKLYVIIKFTRKYNYLYKYSYYIAIVYINYKLLIYFLKFDIYKNIYDY